MSFETLPQRFKSNNIPLEQLPRQLLQEWKEILNATFSETNSTQNKCWHAIPRDQIANAMFFVLSQSSNDNNDKYLVHIIELLFSQISPIERAKEIREVAWKLHQTSTSTTTMMTAQNQNEINECIRVIQKSCRRLLTGLFLLSDILMNLTQSPQHNKLRFIIVSFLDVNNFIQELAEFVVVPKRREIHEQVAKDDSKNTNKMENQQQQGIVQLNVSSTTSEGEDSISVIVGWIRELWAMWRLKGIFPVQFIEKMENLFGFLLVTPTMIMNGARR